MAGLGMMVIALLNQGGKYKEKCDNLIRYFPFCDIFLF